MITFTITYGAIMLLSFISLTLFVILISYLFNRQGDMMKEELRKLKNDVIRLSYHAEENNYHCSYINKLITIELQLETLVESLLDDMEDKQK